MGVFDHLYESIKNSAQLQMSFKIGIGSAAAASLLHFLIKGIPHRSIFIGIYTLVPMTIGTSFFYDYQRVKQKLRTQQYEATIKHRLLTEGTEDDPASNTP
ncbi:uncharacterized protein LOC120326927 [Styela clava]|uniref:uncharacterized protein LOC120326927 n=1 Tax=Styela clava TaxID=7725 RepID=UPI00193A323D|nr:uncharacterized protein LOC120326927 [Styela clava]